jgi:hypothetical protein
VAVTIKKSGPGIRGLEEKMRALRASQVYVGIPAEKTLRQGDEINNASLLWLLSKGSPLRNIPATPILEPAVENSKKLTAPELAAAAKAILDSKPSEATVHLKRAGQIAVNAAKRMFTDNDWPPNAPSTIARKMSKSAKKQLAAGKITYTEAAEGVLRNVDSGQLRRAITYVLAENGRETRADEVKTEQVRQPSSANAPAVSTPAFEAGDVEEAATLGQVLGEAAIL